MSTPSKLNQAVQAALLAQKAMPRATAFRRMALELAKGAELLLERANQMQVEAGHPQRFLVATEEASGEGRPPLRLHTPDGG